MADSTYRVVCDLPTPVRTAVIAINGLLDSIIVRVAEWMPKCGPHPTTSLPLLMTYSKGTSE
jgi:hypothetical protein